MSKTPVVLNRKGWLIPSSCRKRPIHEIETALTAAYGNVGAAARRLGVPHADLRDMVDAMPHLLDAALEGVERLLDKAEETVYDGLERGEYKDRLAAAAMILTKHVAAKRRGWNVP